MHYTDAFVGEKKLMMVGNNSSQIFHQFAKYVCTFMMKVCSSYLVCCSGNLCRAVCNGGMWFDQIGKGSK